MSIEATENSLENIFLLQSYQFVIPTYQRPYAWTTEQATDLVNDIISAFPYSEPEPIDYFLGSIVVIQEPKKPKAEVVDGQQRLTSLTLLLSVIRHMLPSEKSKEKDKITALLQNEDFSGKMTTGLKIREQDEVFFADKIRNDGGLETLLSLDSGIATDSQELLRSNAKVFIEELQNSCPDTCELSEWLWHLICSILKNCYLVVVATADFDTAYRIFSTLNTRGLDLETCDILKAEILGAIQDATSRERYRLIWEGEESDLGRKDFDTLFTHIHRIQTKERAKKNFVTEYREKIRPTENPEQFIDEHLKPYSDAYEIIDKGLFLCDNPDMQTQINHLFLWLGRIDNSDWIPPALHFLVKNPYHSSSVFEFYTKLERLAAGLMILRKDINMRARIYRRVLEAIDEGVEQAISTTSNQLSDDDISQIVEILNGDLYPLYRIRSYILLRLDSQLAEGGLSPSFNTKQLTVEHVLPQNPVKSWFSNWKEENERKQWVHRLGNLVLLSRRKNSQAQNFDFAKKKQHYFSQGESTVFPLTSSVLNCAEWTPSIVKENQKFYLQKLADIWSLGDVSSIV